MKPVAHYINTEDCMGNAVGYWRAEQRCADGKFIMATGSTAQQAIEELERKVKEQEAISKKPPMERLKLLTAGSLLDTDKCEAIRIITQILESLIGQPSEHKKPCAWKDCPICDHHGG